VAVVVVNFHGGVRTVDCVRAVAATTWPAERLRIFVVDNGDTAPVADDLRRAVPDCLVLRPGRNLGFAGACNLALAAASGCDYVALLNNDATPDPGWLEHLTGALAGGDVGAATPKVVLDRTFLEVRVRVPEPTRSIGDPRALGVQVSGVRVDGIDVTAECYLRDGCWGWETDPVSVGGRFTWTGAAATLLVPAQQRPQHLEIRHSNGLTACAAMFATDEGEVTVRAEAAPKWVTVPAAVDPGVVLNNAGMVLLSDGRTADRGFLELDRGQFDEPCEVFGFSAAAVVLSRGFLDDVGGFDDGFFLYYEDADLSWRGRARGWRYCYVPTAQVAHEHSATVGQSSRLAEHLSARNRLVMLTKNAPQSVVALAVGGLLRDLAAAGARDVVGRVLRLQRPVLRHVIRQGRVLVGYGRMLPRAMVDRHRIRRTARVPDADIMRWAEATPSGELRLRR